MDDVIPLGHRSTDGRQRDRSIQRELREGRTDSDIVDERRLGASKDAQARHRDVFAERIRDEIDRVTQLDERADPVVSENGVPRGSKNGSGAIMRIFTA